MIGKKDELAVVDVNRKGDLCQFCEKVDVEARWARTGKVSTTSLLMNSVVHPRREDKRTTHSQLVCEATLVQVIWKLFIIIVKYYSVSSSAMVEMFGQATAGLNILRALHWLKSWLHKYLF